MQLYISELSKNKFNLVTIFRKLSGKLGLINCFFSFFPFFFLGGGGQVIIFWSLTFIRGVKLVCIPGFIALLSVGVSNDNRVNPSLELQPGFGFTKC